MGIFPIPTFAILHTRKINTFSRFTQIMLIAFGIIPYRYKDR